MCHADSNLPQCQGDSGGLNHVRVSNRNFEGCEQFLGGYKCEDGACMAGEPAALHQCRLLLTRVQASAYSWDVQQAGLMAPASVCTGRGCRGSRPFPGICLPRCWQTNCEAGFSESNRGSPSKPFHFIGTLVPCICCPFHCKIDCRELMLTATLL